MINDDYGDPAEMAYRDLDEDGDEPCGSCEECGTNLYPEDDFNYCDQCLWRMESWI